MIRAAPSNIQWPTLMSFHGEQPPPGHRYLRHGLQLPERGGRQPSPAADDARAEYLHGDFSSGDQQRRPQREVARVDEHDESRTHEQLVCQRVHELPELRDGSGAARQVAVDEIREGGDYEDRRTRPPPRMWNRRRTRTRKTGIRTTRPTVIQFGRFIERAYPAGLRDGAEEVGPLVPGDRHRDPLPDP